MQISAYMSSIRPYRWMGLHNRLKQTGMTFEMVIVGPVRPDFELPPEIRYEFSEVKPSQCFEAAIRMCTGDVMLQIVDDVMYEPGTIETMYDVITQNDKVMASAHYYQNGNDFTPYQNIAGQHRNDLPLLPVCGMYPRKALEEVGSLDKRFAAVMSELDLYQRLSVIGGYRTHFVEGRVNEDTGPQDNEGTSLCKKYWGPDRSAFINLWSTNGNLCCTRNDEYRPYVDENILTVNQ